ncbi:SusC/RagA family TonB-linked outer membrane protein [Membranihabitans marinus]|uniref:SusC/RagA family TonB-linked outer membrane protein n=1 Tax=Membranihabitans marinus TaxID=1227546 RepID=UPI001F002DE4|nr:SusC/RagA family TonB-linked outer membrane protein [Membranihabitans marinus]
MKLSILILFCTFFGLQAKTGFSQDKISLDLKNVSIENLLDEIESNTEYRFVYKIKDVDLSRTISLNIENAEIASVLNTIFEPTDTEYRIIDRQIFLFDKVDREFESMLKEKEEAWIQALAANVLDSIVGQVKDEAGEPLIGVNVVVKGKYKGTATGSNGEFTLYDIADEDVLLFTYIGYSFQELPVDGKAYINVVMQEDTETLEEVVVTGYYSLPKERATGSFSHTTEKELETTTSLSVKDQLEGLVPGLMFEPNFNQDQSPSTERSRSILIRGQSTLGDNSPLIVVDGFPIISSEGVDPWSTINPDDVKSVTVLKDAAAASIWGAQAANGVIVVKTKDGSGVKGSSFNVSVDYITRPQPNLYDIPFATGQESIEIYKSLFLENTYFDALLSSFNRPRYEFPEVIDVLLQMKAEEITEQEGNAQLNALSSIDVRDEFTDLFYRNMETSKKVNLSYNISSANNTMRASVMALQSDKAAIGDVDQQVLGSISNNFTPVDWFSLSFGINFSLMKKEENGVAIGEINNIPQMSRILDDNGDYLTMIKQNYDDSYYDVPTQKRRDLVEQYNLPYDWDWNLKREIDNQDNTENINNLRLNTKVAFKPFKGLEVSGSYQFQNNHSLVSNYMNEETWYVRNSVNENARPDGSFPVPAGGMLYERKSDFISHDARFQATYDLIFGDHEIRALGGMEIKKDEYESMPYGYYGYDPQALTQITGLNFQDDINPKLTGDNEWRGSIHPIPTVPKTSVRITGRDDRFVSYYGNGIYTYLGKYDITGSIRLDQTNLYGRSASYRELPQWSVGAGWTISDEAFFNLPVVDYLRARISYGWNGHVDKNASPYINGTPWVDPVNQLQYAAVLSTPNPGLTWEKTSNYNLGFDMALLRNRLELGIEFYNKKSKDVLTNIKVNPTYGFYYDAATLNTGNITNKGVEWDLSALVIDRKVKWQTRLNYSYNKNVVDNVKTSSSNMATYTALAYFNPVAGQPRDYIAVAEWAGFSDEGLPQVIYQGEVTSVTDINYSSSDIDDLFKFVGQRSPKHFGSWSNTVSFARFELTARVLYSFGHKFFKDTPPRSLLYNYQSFRNFFTFNTDLLVDRWQSPADNETASMYSLDTRVSNYLTTLTNDYLSEYNTNSILDAGNVRLQNVTLGYNLPRNFIKGVKNVKIQVQARDLGPIFLANKEGVDPQFPKYSSSLYSAYYNVLRDRPTYAVNLKIGL